MYAYVYTFICRCVCAMEQDTSPWNRTHRWKEHDLNTEWGEGGGSARIPVGVIFVHSISSSFADLHLEHRPVSQIPRGVGRV